LIDYFNVRKIPYLFAILCFALLALMAFQISWINESRTLIEEQFDQKVNLAMGSALSDFNSTHKVSLAMEDLQACDDDNSLKYIPVDKGSLSYKNQVELESSLADYMTCYGIDDKYRVEIFNETCATTENTYCCSIGMTSSDTLACNTDYMLAVSFLSRNDYLQDKIRPMIISSVLIFLLLASVSFILLWSLIKQKRITENNIDFFNNTAHELKTPLTNISLALKLLGKKFPELVDDRYAGIIKSENNKLAKQIERVLFLSRLENGEYRLQKEKLNLYDLLHAVVENMKLLTDEYNGRISIQSSSKDISIAGDYVHLTHVFKNLIENALKYCDENPKIQIQLLEDESNVRVILRDNGIGISAKDQVHIFEKFQRVNTGDRRQVKGFGLGLSYVKTVIELHKGLVQLKSERNKGSEFHVLLPNLK